MKMRYIIFTVILMCLLKVGVLAQSWTSTGININTVGGDAILGVYGEDITTYNFVIPFYKKGTAYYWCPGKLILRDKTTEEVLFQSEILSEQAKGSSNSINIPLSGLCDVWEQKTCILKFVPNSDAVPQGLKQGDQASNFTKVKNNAEKEIKLSISPRPIKINPNSYDDYYSSKTYDGGSDVKDGFISIFKPNTYYSSDDTKSGILVVDRDYVSFDIKSAAYKNKNCAGEKNSAIEVEFQNGGLLGDKSGNYKLVFDDANTDKKLTFPGTITPKPLDLNLAFAKTYDGGTSLSNSHLTSNTISTGVLHETVTVSLKSTGNAKFNKKDVHTDWDVTDISKDDIELNDNNYSVNSVTAKGTITKRKITPQIKFSKPYDGDNVATNSLTEAFKDYKLTHTNCTDVIDGEEVPFSFTGATFMTSSEYHLDGIVYIDGLSISSSNYVLDDSKYYEGKYKASGSITKQPITISLENTEFTYGTSTFGTDINPSVSETSPAIGGTFTAKDKNSTAEPYSDGVMLPAGEYTISYTPTDTKNYESPNTVSCTVKRKEIDVVLHFEKVYDGNADVEDRDYTATLTTASGIVEGDNVSISFTSAAFDSKDVHVNKEVKAKVSEPLLIGTHAKNYSMIFSATSTITSKELKNVDFYFEKEYDKSTDASSSLITVNPLKGDKVTEIIGNDEVSFSFTNPKFPSANADETNLKTIQYDNLVSENPNYTFVTPNVKGKIQKKELEISLTNSSVIYGGSKLLTDISPSITPNENPTGTAIPGTFVAKNKSTNENSGDVMLPAGEYEVTFELPDNEKDNYKIKETKTVTVNPKSIQSINLSYEPEKIYDATKKVLGFTYGPINELVNGDEITITAEYTDKKADDNAYIKITISPSDFVKQNYSCVGTKILKSNEEITTLTDWGSAEFSVLGKISKCQLTLTSDYQAEKEYDGTTDVKDFEVTQVTAKTNDGNKDFNELTFAVFENEEITITPKAAYNSKDVNTANKITVSGDVNNDNYEVEPKTVYGSISKSIVKVEPKGTPAKDYDGDKTVKDFDEYYTVSGIFNNEVQFNFDKVEYQSENASDNIPLVFTNPHLEGSSLENYDLSVSQFYGKINKHPITIKWYRTEPEMECTNSVSMSYGHTIGSGKDLYAQIYEVLYRDKYRPEIYTYSDDDGQTFKELPENGILFPGEYSVKVNFSAEDNNYKSDFSKIDVKIGFQWQFGREFTTPSEYGVKIGEDIYFYCTTIGINEDDLTFTYYLDNEEVNIGYIPKVGVHTLTCEVKHPTLGEYKITEPINFEIVPRQLTFYNEMEWTTDKDGNILSRPYDGTVNVYDDQIKEIAQINKDQIISGDELYFNIDYAYDGEEVGDHEVNITYTLTGKDSYCYVFQANELREYSTPKPGFIKLCPAFVGFKEYEKVYGSSELGKDIVPTTTYVRYKGDKISIPGTYIFEFTLGGNEKSEHQVGEMLSVGVYNMRVKFYPEDQEHYEEGASNSEYVKVTPKPITATGVTIADKYYDGTKRVDPAKVKLFEPALEGVIERDKNNVKLEISNLSSIEYPSVNIGDYQGLVVKVALKGSGLENYKLTNSELKADASILPFDFHYNVEPDDETGFYLFVYGSSVMGKDFKLINELTETQTVKYKIADIDKTNQMLVPNTYKVDVQLYDSDLLVQTQQVTVKVVKLKLLTSEPNIAHTKFHDGNTLVKLTGEKCILTNIVGDDKVEINTQEQFYDTPDIGTGKTITVTFTLSGSWHSKYIEPDGYVYTDGVITNRDLKISSLGVSGEICPSSNVPLIFSVDEGIPDKADIVFSQAALEAGFENFTVTNTQFGLNSIELKIPEKMKAGKYDATLSLSSGQDIKLDTRFSFTVNYDASYIVSKFNDVVAINNSGYDFTGYQWYKDGKPVDNENKQFFNDLPCLYGWYGARVLTVDGTYANICPRYFDKRTAVSKSAKAGVNVYPNPAAPMQTVNIELEEFEDYENCTILIYNLNGVLITKIQNPDRLNTLCLPQGNYTGVVVKDNSRLNFKLIVRK
ncbi:MAG: hypothetical protein II956_07095 [Bacteroidales bacterium]|nr:hypothetical protein [Bacteroidales bacterium]